MMFRIQKSATIKQKKGPRKLMAPLNYSLIFQKVRQKDPLASSFSVSKKVTTNQTFRESFLGNQKVY